MGWVCGRPLAGIEVSKPAGAGMVIGFECFVCQLEVSAAGRSHFQRSTTEYVCAVIIRHNENALHLQ